MTYNLNAGVSMNWSDEWRLPTTTQPDPTCDYQVDPGGGMPLQGHGNRCTGSELGHLYYTELGNIGQPDTGFGLSNTGDFQDLQANYYWSGTEYAPNPDNAWFFGNYYGDQYADSKDYNHYAIAVRSGDIAVVPEPISSTLFLVGGAALGFRRFRKK